LVYGVRITSDGAGVRDVEHVDVKGGQAMKKFTVSYTRLGGRLERTEVFCGQSAADVVEQVMAKYPRCRIHKVSSKEEMEAAG